jgi:hypothetical protein
MSGSERFQPSDEIGIVTPLSGAPDSFELRLCFPYSFAFGFQINGKGVAIATGQRPTLSQCGIGLSQRAKAFAMEFPFDVKQTG